MTPLDSGAAKPQPPEVVFQAIMAHLHRRWRVVMCVPLVYLLIGALLWKYYFAPRGGEGLMPSGDTALAVLIVLSGLAVALLWRLLERLRIQSLIMLIAGQADDDPQLFRVLAAGAQLKLYAVCDLIAAPGIALFLLEGEILLLFVFVLASMVAFLRAMPSERLLGEIYFRRLHAS